MLNSDDSMVVIDQQAPHRSKAGMAIVAAIACMFVLGIGSTYAMLTYQGNQTPNRFTVAEYMTCDLLEPEWTNAAMQDNQLAVDATSVTTPASIKYYDSVDKVGIPAAAAAMVPGSMYSKNPFVVNTSTLDDVTGQKDKYDCHGVAGIKVQFQMVDKDTGKYKNMSKDDVTKLLTNYYIGKKVENDSGEVEQPSSSSTAGFTALGDGWEQLSAGDYGEGSEKANDKGAMYFVYKKRLAPLSATTTNIAALEDATSPTWGYETGSDYATTPLFGAVRYVDGTTQANISALNELLDPNGEVTKAGYAPGWRMVISSGIISCSSDTLAEHAADTTSDYYTQMKGVLDATSGTAAGEGDYPNQGDFSAKPKASTGIRSSSELGNYVTVTGFDTDGKVSEADVTEGTGVAEPSNINNDGN